MVYGKHNERNFIDEAAAFGKTSRQFDQEDFLFFRAVEG